MGMVKEFLMEYCEAMRPDDFDGQDRLFQEIMEGEQPPLEEMQQVVKAFHHKREARENLYSRLSNYKFESALSYLPDSKLEEHDEGLVKYLAVQFGNSGWIMGDFGHVLINASLRSLPGFVNYLKASGQWE